MLMVHLWPWTHAMTILLPDKESWIPTLLVRPLRQHINLITSQHVRELWGYMRTRLSFWHDWVLLRSLCMLFEEHAPPLIIRLPLPLPLSTQRNVTQRKRVEYASQRGKNTIGCVHQREKTSSFEMCWLLKQRITVSLQIGNTNPSISRAGVHRSSRVD